MSDEPEGVVSGNRRTISRERMWLGVEAVEKLSAQRVGIEVGSQKERGLGHKVGSTDIDYRSLFIYFIICHTA